MPPGGPRAPSCRASVGLLCIYAARLAQTYKQIPSTRGQSDEAEERGPKVKMHRIRSVSVRRRTFYNQTPRSDMVRARRNTAWHRIEFAFLLHSVIGKCPLSSSQSSKALMTGGVALRA